jgi:hypothetical protein
MRRAWLLLAAILTFGACSSGGGGADGGGRGGVGGGAGQGGGSAGTQGGAGTSGGGGGAGGTAGTGPPIDCTQFANPAPMISQTLSGDAPPITMGGTIETGTYYLTSYTFHQSTGACPLRPYRSTLFVEATSSTAGTLREVYDIPNATYWFWYTYTTNTTQMLLNPLPTCPLSTTSIRTYTATPAMLTFVQGGPPPCGNEVRVYTKQ